MSLVDRSMKFSFSSYKPLASPNGQYIISIHNSTQLIIRSTQTLERIRTIDLTSKSFAKITQISWNPNLENNTKFAVLLESEAVIKVYDVLDEEFVVEIEEEPVFGIEKFEWLRYGKQIVIFSRDSLFLRIYHILGKKVLEIDRPKINQVVQRDDSALFMLFTEEKNGNIIAYTLINRVESCHVAYKVNLGSFVNLTQIKVSPSANWIVVNDAILGEVKLNVYSMAGSIKGINDGSLFAYRTDSDPLGAVDFMFLNDDEILVADHKESIHRLKISDGFKLISYYETKVKIDKDLIDVSQEVNFDSLAGQDEFIEVPHLTKLPLEWKGVSKFLVNGLLFILVKSMPTSVFAFDLASVDIKAVIVSKTIVRDITTVEKIPNLLLILSGSTVIVWNNGVTSSLSLYNEGEPQAKLSTLQVITSTEDFVTVLISDADKSFVIVQIRLSQGDNDIFQKMNSKEIEQLRNGSPALANDLSRVIELAAGVQQSEWGQNTSRSIQVEDTFLTKKKQRR